MHTTNGQWRWVEISKEKIIDENSDESFRKALLNGDFVGTYTKGDNVYLFVKGKAYLRLKLK